MRGPADGPRSHSLVRPALIPQSTILASVKGAYNAIWVKVQWGADTFYYGRGAGRIHGVQWSAI